MSSYRLAVVCVCALCLYGCVDHPFNDPNCCGSGPEQHVSLCGMSSGKSEILPPSGPNHDQRFVHITGLDEPKFAVDDQDPIDVNGLPIDDFMVAHPRGYGEHRFSDLDGDGDLDVVMPTGTMGGTTVLVLRNEGNETFTRWHTLSGGYTARICDVDQDGDPDVVSLIRYPVDMPGGLFINDGLGNLTDEGPTRLPPVNEVQDAACFDLDGDGAPEILAATWYEAERLLLNDGSGYFAEGPLLPPGEETPARFVRTGDLDGDGWIDAVIGGEEGSERILMNRAGELVPGVQLPSGGFLAAALGDVDGDGDLDLALGGRDGSFLRLNDGSGNLSQDGSGMLAILSSQHGYCNYLSLGDHDGDGDLDWELQRFEPHVLINTLIHPYGEDSLSPEVEILEPVDDTVAHIPPRIRIDFRDNGTGIDPDSFRVTLNGLDITEQLETTHDSSTDRGEEITYSEGQNVLNVTAKDMAGNGTKQSAVFMLDNKARPFATHLEARDINGQVRDEFSRGEPVIFVLRLTNGGGVSLPVYGGCGAPKICVYDSRGKTVWIPIYVCPRILSYPVPVPPCSEEEFAVGWDQTHWLFTSQEGQVPKGTYYVQGCIYGEFPGLQPPPQIRIVIK